MLIDRRTLLAAGTVGVAVAPAAARSVAAAPSPVLAALAPAVPPYLAAHNAPGMILALADAAGHSETAEFGVADLSSRRAIDPHERFHIGSITKSFAALMTLQLVDEGKVDLAADIRDYLPEVALKTPFGPVTVHHLLCHSSGLPSAGPAAGWPDQTVEQAFKPGSRFYYCNLSYGWLGNIIVRRGGEAWPAALRRRILNPLGMSETSPQIGAGMRAVEVPSFVRRDDDRPYPRQGPLTPAAPLTFTAASGCIASTAADMARYVTMLARHGAGPRGRLVSPAGFTKMTTTQIDASSEFGTGVGYGYGFIIDRVDGRPVIRHTGGMVSFMSSLHVDLDGGFGAFASINAQQNYRPVPVTAQAIRLFRAAAAGTPPVTAALTDPEDAVATADYVGEYVGPGQRRVTVARAGGGLTITIAGRTLPVDSVGGRAFVAREPGYRLLSFAFARAPAPAGAAADAPNPAVSVAWGRDIYVRAGAVPAPPAVADTVPLSAADLAGYEGLYGLGDGWVRAVRIVARGGRLWVDSFDGVAALAHLGGGRFRFAEEAGIPDTVAFSPAGVAPRTAAMGETVLTRLGDPFLEIA